MSEAPWNVAADFPQRDPSEWRALVEKGLAGKPFSTLETEVEAGITLSPLYLESAADDGRVGEPGIPPYVRGTSPEGHVSRGWIVRQEYDDPRMEIARDAIADDLARGSQGVWLRLGLDQGIRILTTGDLAVVLEHVDLARTSVNFEPEADFLATSSAFIALADSRGVARGALVGCFGADPVGTLARTGRLPSGLDGAMRDAADLAGFAVRETPLIRAMLANSRPYSDAGAGAVLELAFTIATGVAYLRRLVDSGLDVDEASRQIEFALSVSGPFFVDVAKLRAARWLWSKAVAVAGGSAESQAMLLHARTALFTKTARDPWVNMLRSTAEGFAAAVGGADSIATSAFDVAVGPSEELGRRVARNQQLILRDESNLHRVVDPAGGSYYVETLTEQLARAAWDEIRNIEREGGMERAVSRGYVARALEKANERRVADILRRKAPIVGVSEFANLDEAPLARETIDWHIVEGELGHRFGTSTPEAVHGALMDFARVAQARERKPGELVSRAIAAASLGVDFYSLSAVHRLGRAAVYSEPLPSYRASVAFEALRAMGDAFLTHRGRRPRALLVGLGPAQEHAARTAWVKNLLAIGGIEGHAHAATDGAALTAALAAASADFVVFCGKDASYAERVPELAPAAREAGANAIGVAGKPGDDEDRLREAGVDLFFFAGANVHGLLGLLLGTFGGAR